LHGKLTEKTISAIIFWGSSDRINRSRSWDRAVELIDRVVGIYHFFFDKVPRNIPEVPPKPRKRNLWLKDGKAIVAKISTHNDVRRSIDQALAALGPLTATISRGDKVLVKPNFNSADPPPASTDLPFLKAMIELLLELGAKVIIGESSGGVWRPTANVFRRLGLYEFARNLGVKLVAFEEKPNEWVRIPIEGEYLHSVAMPRSAYDRRPIGVPALFEDAQPCPVFRSTEASLRFR